MKGNLNIYYSFITYIFKTIPKIILLINLKQAEISISTNENNLIFLTSFFKKHTNQKSLNSLFCKILYQ